MTAVDVWQTSIGPPRSLHMCCVSQRALQLFAETTVNLHAVVQHSLVLVTCANIHAPTPNKQDQVVCLHVCTA